MPGTDYDLEGSDLVLLLLAAPTVVPSASNRVNGITRLEKLLFLAQEETDVDTSVAAEKLSFKAYNYGPFSKEVYEAVDLLRQSGLLVEERAVDGKTIDSVEDLEVTGAYDSDEFIERQFQLTSNGEAVAKLLAAHHPSVVQNLSAIKDSYADRSLSSLIGYVYRKYPDAAEKSLIRGRYLK